MTPQYTAMIKSWIIDNCSSFIQHFDYGFFLKELKGNFQLTKAGFWLYRIYFSYILSSVPYPQHQLWAWVARPRRRHRSVNRPGKTSPGSSATSHLQEGNYGNELLFHKPLYLSLVHLNYVFLICSLKTNYIGITKWIVRCFTITRNK